MTARRAQMVCAALLVLFVVLSLHAVRQKSSTFDEPLDVYAAWNQRYLDDFTIIPEHPPLWTMLASLALEPDSLKLDAASSNARSFTEIDAKRDDRIVFDAMYRTPGVNAERLVQRARAAMVLTGVVLGLLLALWAFELAGPMAAVIALTFLVFDPSFLGHAPLVKNDTFAAMVIFAVAYATWRTGRAVTVGNVAFLSLACAATFLSKFTALPFGAMAVLLLIIRAFMSEQPKVRHVRSAAIIALILATTSVAATWAVYRFRFEPTPTARLMFNTDRFLEDYRHRDLAAKHPGQQATTEEIAQWTPPLFGRAVEIALRYRLMPSAWLHGLMFMRSHTLMRESYLLGNVTMFGTWWYFPFALLVKLPLGILAAITLAVGAGLVLVRAQPRIDRWALWCILAPSAGLIAATLASNLNIGIRHALPLLPLAYLVVGIVAARAIERWRAPATAAVVALIFGTAAETLHASPDYIAFFNVTAGGSEGGIKLLGDSNLDWGQDLPLLAQWRKEHSDRPLYMSYFGFTDPAAYGIDYQPMPGDFVHPQAYGAPERPAYMAISATNLQGVYLMGATQQLNRSYLDVQPIAKLGGTIYVYDLPKK